jgi:hypothetical protein
MPIIVRVRWQGGYVEVSDNMVATPHRTIPFDAGNVKTKAKAIEVGQTVLQEWANRPVRSWQVRLGRTPVWPGIGDRIRTYDVDGTLTDQRLTARRVSITSGGFASLEPTLGTPRDILVARNQRTLKKLTDGLGGRSAASEPLLTVDDTGFVSGQMTERQVLSWSNRGLLVENGPETELSELTTLVRLQMLLTNNDVSVSGPGGSQIPVTVASPLNMNVWFNNISPGLFSFPNGVSEYNYLLASPIPAGTKIKYGLVYAGNPVLNPTSTIRNYTLTLNLFGVTGTWVQETKNDPEIR